MSAEPIAVLKSLRGEPIPLQRVDLSGVVDGCLLEFTVEQRYRNVESTAIEAVYTFPLPMNAVLLALELEVGERRLVGVVQRKAEAAEVYEDAIAAGHSALLLEKARDGLYTVSLGNLQPGEDALVRYRYAELLSLEQARVRIAIPTAVAPRYGRADTAIDAHQVPSTDLLAEYPCSLRLKLRGGLAQGRAHSPTHRLASRVEADALVLESSAGFALDRDVVVLVEGLGALAQPLLARDGAGYVALASVEVPMVAALDAPKRALKLLIDCSGSMGGDSIAQGRVALLSVLQGVAAGDAVSLTRFGSGVAQVTRGVERMTPAGLRRLEESIRRIEADLGGTEMKSALDAVLALPSERPADILLITDGEVWEIDAILERVGGAGHRLFVIAVGSSPAEELARKVAAVTRGACEFVTPGEDMGAAVERMRVRLEAPVVEVAEVAWPAEPLWTLGRGAVVFPGGTFHVMAGFAAPPIGRLEVTLTNAARVQVPLPASAQVIAALPRVAAERRLATLDREAAARLAEQYQLVTGYTSCVVVLEREAAAGGAELPALRPVPQMLAAGWGGSGSVVATGHTRFPVELRDDVAFNRLDIGPPAAQRSFFQSALVGEPLPAPLAAMGAPPRTSGDSAAERMRSVREELAAHQAQVATMADDVRKLAMQVGALRAQGAEARRAFETLREQLERALERAAMFEACGADLEAALSAVVEKVARAAAESRSIAGSVDDALSAAREVATRSSFEERLLAQVEIGGGWPASLAELMSLGCDEALLRELAGLVARGHREKDVVTAWLANFAEGALRDVLEDRVRTRLVRGADRELRKLLRNAA